MTHPRFFGYGSLVNRSTHHYPDGTPETLQGWRRTWVRTNGYDSVLLSVKRDDTSTIDGLTAQVPHGDWDALDERERGYNRHQTPHFARETWVYAVPDHAHLPSGKHHILRSYLDVVVQGFLREFGEDGVDRFFATTDNWVTILDDRHDPRYPRHQTLSAPETELVEHHIAKLASLPQD